MKKILKIIGIGLVTFTVLVLIIYAFFPSLILDGISRTAIKSGGFSKQTILIENEKCFYFENEVKDKPTLVFIHGFSDIKETWFPFVNPLSKDYHIIVPDLQGHGEMEKDWDIHYSLDNQADFLKKFLDKLNIEHPHLIGASMGGGVAGKYAVLYPDDLASATLISSAGINGNANEAEMQIYMEQFETVEEKMENLPLLPNELDKESVALFKKYIFYKNLGVPNHLLKQYLKRSVEHKDFYLKVMNDFVDTETGDFSNPLDDELRHIKVPVLVIWGKQDPLLDVSSVEVFEDSLRAPITIALVDSCGHATIAEQPKNTLQPIEKFLKDII